MTYKVRPRRSAFGARKGASAIDPRDWEEHELEQITRRFRPMNSRKRDLISPSQNVPAPDMGTRRARDGLDRRTSTAG